MKKEKTKEEKRKYNHEYYMNHRGKACEYSRQVRERKKAEWLAQDGRIGLPPKQYDPEKYAKNKEMYSRIQKTWIEKNKNHLREYGEKYYEANRKRLLEKQRKYAESRRNRVKTEEEKERERQRYLKNRERILAERKLITCTPEYKEYQRQYKNRPDVKEKAKARYEANKLKKQQMTPEEKNLEILAKIEKLKSKISI
jgi:hypothetical protein